MLVVVGIPGSGKTFFASQFSETFNSPYIDYGYYRRVAGDAKSGTHLAGYSLLQIMKAKQTVVLEGRGATAADRQEIVQVAHKAGYNVLYIWVQTDPDASEDRALTSKVAPISITDFNRQLKEFQSLGEKENYVVISGKHTYASQARVVLKRLVDARENPVKTILPTPTRNHPGRGRLVR
jgi:predicted kinase